MQPLRRTPCITFPPSLHHLPLITGAITFPYITPSPSLTSLHHLPLHHSITFPYITPSPSLHHSITFLPSLHHLPLHHSITFPPSLHHLPSITPSPSHYIILPLTTSRWSNPCLVTSLPHLDVLINVTSFPLTTVSSSPSRDISMLITGLSVGTTVTVLLVRTSQILGVWKLKGWGRREC